MGFASLGCAPEGAAPNDSAFHVEKLVPPAQCPTAGYVGYLATDPVPVIPHPIGGRLYVTGDLQGAPHPWIASLIAANLIKVTDRCSREQISARDVLERYSPSERLPVGEWDVAWQGGPDIVVQIGDLVHGGPVGKGGVNSVGAVKFANKLRAALRTKGGALFAIMGNHDYGLLTSPLGFPYLALGTEAKSDFCAEFFGHRTEVGGFVRRMVIALRVGRVLLSHTGLIGDADLTRAGNPSLAGYEDRDAFRQNNFRPLDVIGFRRVVRAALGKLHHPSKELFGILKHHPWRGAVVPDVVNTPYTMPRDWMTRMAGPLQRYFDRIGVKDIVVGHSSTVSGDNPTRRVMYRRILSAGGDTYSFVKTDTQLALYHQRALGKGPKDWMLRCARWGEGGRCASFERLQLVEGGPAIVGAWKEVPQH